MCLILQGRRFQVQGLKPCKFVQDSSEEVLDFKARRLARQLKKIDKVIKSAKKKERVSCLFWPSEKHKSYMWTQLIIISWIH